MSLCHQETRLKHHSFHFSQKTKTYDLGTGFQTGLETLVSFPERETWWLEGIFYFKLKWISERNSVGGDGMLMSRGFEDWTRMWLHQNGCALLLYKPLEEELISFLRSSSKIMHVTFLTYPIHASVPYICKTKQRCLSCEALVQHVLQISDRVWSVLSSCSCHSRVLGWIE